MNIPVDLAWIEAVMLASVRFISFVVIAPPFSHRAFPGTVKALLGVGLGLGVAPRVTPGFEVLDGWEFFGAIITEAATGFTLGFLVFLIFSAIQSAGGLVDFFGGFQIAQAFDPQSQVNGAQFSRLFAMASIALMFTTGAYLVVLTGLFNTFDAVPVGGGVSLPFTVEQMIESFTGMFVGAVQIAGPLIIILFLADAGLGLLTRVAPALNAFALGFPIKILLTLVFGVLIFTALPAVVGGLTDLVVRAFVEVTEP